MKKSKNYPLNIVETKPVYDEYTGKFIGWVMSVDFSGDAVPRIFWGSVRKESPVTSKKSPMATRGEYLFKERLFTDSYARMCRVQKSIDAKIQDKYAKDLKKNKIRPVHVISWYESEVVGRNNYWRVNTFFKGDIRFIFETKGLAHACGLKPIGSDEIESEYSPETDITVVRYKFDSVIVDISRRCASRFEKQMKEKIEKGAR